MSKTNQSRRWWVVTGIIVVIASAGVIYYRPKTIQEEKPVFNNESQSVNSVPNTVARDDSAETSPSSSTPPAEAPKQTLPNEKLLSVPFLSQAPFADWDALHEDACEETSLLMVAHALKGIPISSLEAGDQEIKDLIAYETGQGLGPSITLDQLNQVAKAKYDLNSGQVKTNVSVDAIKQEIAAGHPVIIPAAGKILPNPNFRNGGPNYHMLVVIGYNDREFITNDPGTRKGKEFVYKYDDLIHAIHDWDPQNILNGQKAYLVFN